MDSRGWEGRAGAASHYLERAANQLRDNANDMGHLNGMLRVRIQYLSALTAPVHTVARHTVQSTGTIRQVRPYRVVALPKKVRKRINQGDLILLRLSGLQLPLWQAISLYQVLMKTWEWLSRQPDKKQPAPPKRKAEQKQPAPPQQKPETALEVKQRLSSAIATDRDNSAGRNNNQCVSWARQRRQSLGATTMPAVGTWSDPTSPHGAKHYVEIYGDNAIPWSELQQQISQNGVVLSKLIPPGTAVVWGTSVGPDGHVAIVEQVTEEGIWVSESNWPVGSGPNVRFIPWSKLGDTHFVPPDAKAKA